MKILHIVDGLHPKRGGVPAAVLNITGMLDAIGIENHILSIGDNPENLPNNVIEFSFKKFLNFGYSTKGNDWLKENYNNYSAIYFHTVWNIAIIKMYRFLIKVNFTYFISPHGSLDPFDLKKKYFLKQIVGRLVVHKIIINAKYIFCTSKTETELIKYFGKNVDNGKVLPLPVDYEGFELGNRERFREKYMIDNQKFVFLFLSRINYKKGLDNFILALHSLINKGKIDKNDFKFIIAGDNNNEYSTKIQSLLEANNLSDISQFIGLVSNTEKADAYVGSDLFVLPSKNENFGIAIIEALQSGTPILISKNVYIYKEIFGFNDNSPGWLCNQNLSDLEDVLYNAIIYNDRNKLKINSFIAGNQYKKEELTNLYTKYFK